MANSGTWLLVLRLCALLLFLEAKVFVLGGDDSNVQGGNTIDGSGGVSEICVNDLASFMPPPYGNSSDIVCRPIWNTFVLRVCLFSIIQTSLLFLVMFNKSIS